MAAPFKPYMLFKASYVFAGVNVYEFRLCLIDDTWINILKALPEGEGDFLFLIDIPTIVPSSIAANEEFSTTTGGSWLAPEPMNFYYMKDSGFIPAIYPSEPGLAGVAIANAIANSPSLFYAGGSIYDGIPHLPGDGPEGHPKTTGDWAEPDYGEFGFALHGVAQRYVSISFSAYNSRYAWAYSGDEEASGAHILENMDTADFVPPSVYNWGIPHLIESDREGVSSGFLIERTVVGGNEYLDVWIYSPNEPYYYYTTDPLVVPSPISQMGGVVPLVETPVFSLFAKNWRFGKRLKLGAKREELILSSEGKALSSEGKALYVEV